MVTRSFVRIALCCFVIKSSLFSHNFYTGKENIYLVSTFETKNCFASYVMIDKQQCLVKQKKDYKKQLAVVRDALAAYIAKDLAIAHQVDIISSDKNFPGKIKSSWPATIHTLAPGETVRKQRESKYNALRLKQQWAHAQSSEEKGLTKLIINYMTWHRQLPIIIALDLFIGNSDRHCGNLCYDTITDSFCAIDMDDTFNKDLCKLAYKNLELMIKDTKNPFTKQEIKALSQMRNTLKFLVQKHQPDDVIAKLYSLAKKAGFVEKGRLYNDSIRKKLLYYQAMIVQTNESVHQLIALLDKIIARAQRMR